MWGACLVLRSARPMMDSTYFSNVPFEGWFLFSFFSKVLCNESYLGNAPTIACESNLILKRGNPESILLLPQSSSVSLENLPSFASRIRRTVRDLSWNARSNLPPLLRLILKTAAADRRSKLEFTVCVSFSSASSYPCPSCLGLAVRFAGPGD